MPLTSRRESAPDARITAVKSMLVQRDGCREVVAWFETLAEEDWDSAEQAKDAIDMLASTGQRSAVRWSIGSRVLRTIT